MLNNMDSLKEAFDLLSTEAKDLYVPYQIENINELPSPITFLKKWVNPNVPVLIKGGAKNWPCCKKWTPSYLKNVMKDKAVTVAVTPTGYADAIACSGGQDMFVLPEERTMHISDLFSKLYGEGDFLDPSVCDSKGIFYLQKQDSNLIKEFPELLEDIDSKLSWASEAFSAEPNAINLWIGDSNSVTSLHKDPFENIYCVVTGYKDFILLPPTDRPWLPYRKLPVAEYKEISPGNFTIIPKVPDSDDVGFVPWIDLDPLQPDILKYPSYVNAHPLHVRVEATDLLYLPSLWFHHVRQSDSCIAVNFWYDMQMDVKFVYYQFLEHLVTLQEDKQQ